MDLSDGCNFIDLNGYRICTRTSGSGEPVFTLLHGFGASLFSWHKVMDTLSRSGTVIAYDRLGFGYSSKPIQINKSNRNPYDDQEQVDLLFALLDHFAIQKTILVGHSAGGLLALMAAIQKPEGIKGLVLEDPAVMRHPMIPACFMPFFRFQATKSVLNIFIRGVIKKREVILERAWFDPQRIDQETRHGYFAPFQTEGMLDALFWMGASSRMSLSDREISAIHVPAIVIHGEEDRIIPARVGEHIAGLISGAHFAGVPACGHIPHEEKPDEFLKILSWFIQELEE